MLQGLSKVRLGATVAAFAKITTAADGEFETAALGDHILGLALEGGDAGEIVEALLYGGAGPVQV